MRWPPPVAAIGGTPHRGARASHYRGLSRCGAQAPDAQAQQPWPTAQPLRGTRDPPRPGPEPASPALAGRLSTTAPPGKPQPLFKRQEKKKGTTAWLDKLCPFDAYCPGHSTQRRILVLSVLLITTLTRFPKWSLTPPLMKNLGEFLGLCQESRAICE